MKVRRRGSILDDHTPLELASGGELILEGGVGNGYRLAELVGTTNPSNWAGLFKVKNTTDSILEYILFDSNP